jgi:antirestriction protein
MARSTKRAGDLPRVYVADLAAYTAGRLHGEWVDLDGDASENHDRLRSAVTRVLDESPVAGAEEVALHDYEGFGELRLGEYEDLETVARAAALINEHGEVFAALVSHLGGARYLDEAIRHMAEQYQGRHDSLEAWAEEYLEDAGSLSEVPESLRHYIDFEAWARDAELNGDVFSIATSEGAVHVFFNH